MKSKLPLVSVIIICRNEEDFIIKCLDSITNQDYPQNRLEVLIIDGMSQDGTRKIIKDYVKKYSYFKFFNNPKKITPVAWNIGIRNSKSEVIMLMGAHATYRDNYISQCVKYLQDYNADNVGGVSIIIPRENKPMSKAIAFALSSSFGAGDAQYKKKFLKEPQWVDTVFGGCYRKKVFEKIGLFNEKLEKAQDMEFNLRLKKNGGKILLVPSIISCYYPRSTLSDFFIQGFKNGFWIVYSLKFSGKLLRFRHYIPFLFLFGLLGIGCIGIFFPIFFYLFLFIFGSYFLISFYFSAKISAKEKNTQYLFLMPVVFAYRHISYGLGSFLGLIKLF